MCRTSEKTNEKNQIHTEIIFYLEMIYAPFRWFSSFLCDIIRSTMKFIG